MHSCFIRCPQSIAGQPQINSHVVTYIFIWKYFIQMFELRYLYRFVTEGGLSKMPYALTVFKRQRWKQNRSEVGSKKQTKRLTATTG